MFLIEPLYSENGDRVYPEITYFVLRLIFKNKDYYMLWRDNSANYEVLDDQVILTTEKKIAVFHDKARLREAAQKENLYVSPEEPNSIDFDHAMDWVYERIPDYEMSYGETLDTWNILMDITVPLGYSKFSCWNLMAASKDGWNLPNAAEKKYKLSKRERKYQRLAHYLYRRIWRLAPMRKRHRYAFKQIFTTGLEMFEKNIQWCD